MSREKENFRDQLERIEKAFPNKEILCRKDVSKFTGICYSKVEYHFTLSRGNIIKVH